MNELESKECGSQQKFYMSFQAAFEPWLFQVERRNNLEITGDK